MSSIDYDLLEKAFTVAGILAGFAFTAGIEILLKAKTDDSSESTSAPKIINVVWLFMTSSVFLIAAFITLAALSNYSSRFAFGNYLNNLTIISLIVFIIGIIALFIAILSSLYSWNRTIFLRQNMKTKKTSLPQSKLVFISLVLLCLYIAFVISSPFIYR